MNISLHAVSQRHLTALQIALPHALLLSGKPGVGLFTAATWVAKKHHVGTVSPKNSKGEPDANGTIGVEAIRTLYHETRSKHTSKQIFIIDDADRMSRGAQAAFLKLLEEPNLTTFFILTSHMPSQLLPTIHSRVQHITIQPLTPDETTLFLADKNVTNETKLTQLQFIAPGLPAELTRLLEDEEYFQSKAKIITDARTFLQASTYQKLRIVHEYKQSREEALHLLDGAIAILHYSLKNKPQQILITQLERLLTAKEGIAANYSIPLQLALIVL